jgi:hypothetical protein
MSDDGTEDRQDALWTAAEDYRSSGDDSDEVNKREDIGGDQEDEEEEDPPWTPGALSSTCPACIYIYI